MKVVILAGGWGSRLGQQTENIPKPMINIGEKPILWHIMKIYSKYGHNDFVISCGVKAQVIKSYFANYQYYNNDSKLYPYPHIDLPFVVVNYVLQELLF